MDALCLSQASTGLAYAPRSLLNVTSASHAAALQRKTGTVPVAALRANAPATTVTASRIASAKCRQRRAPSARRFRVRSSQSEEPAETIGAQEASTSGGVSGEGERGSAGGGNGAGSILSSDGQTATAVVAAKDEVVKFIAGNAEVSVIVVAGTELVRDAQRRHAMAPTAVAALGRLLMGTLLLRAMKGEGETAQVTINGRGPLGQLTALSTDYGWAKGFAHNPLADPPLNDRGKMDVGAAVGKGVLNVVRTHPQWQSAYTGTVPLVSGEIAEDLANYLAESEQVNSALGLGVAVGRDGLVRAAGGFLVQVLPFCSDETLDKLEANVQSLGAMSDAVQRLDAVAIAHHLLRGLDPEPVADPVAPRYGPCDLEELKPRMMRAVESLGANDVQQLLDERGHVEVRCEFCAQVVEFNEDDLKHVLAGSV